MEKVTWKHVSWADQKMQAHRAKVAVLEYESRL